MSKKKTFNLSAEVTISIYTMVEANSLEEAIEISKQRNIEASRLHDGTQRKECWVSDEYDGEPFNIHEIPNNHEGHDKQQH